MVLRKYDFKRRRALECKFVEKSKTSPGYLKYEITICEKDGTIHKQPAYGKDMQSAIARLLNQERTIKVEKKIHNNPFLLFLMWITIMSWPVFTGISQDTPHMLLYSFGGIIGLVGLGTWWYNYISKK
jgi:hypothetical protein